jgi:hypothetical protein
MDGLKVNGQHVAGPGHAITDTGSSELFLPYAAAKKIAQAAGGRAGGGGYIVPCNAKFKVTLTAGGKNYDITQEQLIIPLPRAKMCRLAVAGQGDNMYLFGDPMIRTYCQVHDVQNKRIGFARAKHSNSNRAKRGRRSNG